MTIGETNLPKKTPNLNHKAFNGVNNIEFLNPKNKNAHETISDQIRIDWLFKRG